MASNNSEFKPKYPIPENIDKSMITRLELYYSDQVCAILLSEDNKNKTTDINDIFGNIENSNFISWNDTSLGNLKMVAYYHWNSDVREKAWNLIKRYYEWLHSPFFIKKFVIPFLLA